MSVDVRERDKLLGAEGALVDCASVREGRGFTHGLTVDGRLHNAESGWRDVQRLV